MKNPKKISALLFLFMAILAIQTHAQSVFFPQAIQPGTAQLEQGTNTYVFSNNLFEATYAQENNRLVFKGCSNLALLPTDNLFSIQLKNGNTVSSSQMTLNSVRVNPLKAEVTAVKGSHRFNGYELVANYSYNNLDIVWHAILRDESHYLRTYLELTAKQDVQMNNIVPMEYGFDEAVGGSIQVEGNTRGAILASKTIFAGLESPMGINSVERGGANGYAVSNDFSFKNWNERTFQPCPAGQIPGDLLNLRTLQDNLSLSSNNISYATGSLQVSKSAHYNITFNYTSGTHRLNTVGVDVIDSQGRVVDHDYHCGFTGEAYQANTYTLSVSEPGTYTVRYFVETLTETITSSGNMTYEKSESTGVSSNLTIKGLWSRKTTLQKGNTWHIGAVVGLIAPGQARRSVLVYSERERAVPWRPMPIYNSWYELNIDRNNGRRPENNMTTAQTVPVLDAWKKNLFEQNGVGIKSFVWDDGWDNYQTWECHKNFDFAQPSQTAFAMGAGTGVWLGPVGGYGYSGDQRRAYWDKNRRGGMKLSNPAYYEVFQNAVERMVRDYHGNFFKLDGISSLPSATGPDMSISTGEEDAEAIIKLEYDIRQIKPDVFLNTTVGTWASPFWFQYTDAVWRQEADYSEAGNNSSDREKWITYRDHLVYQNFVHNSPLCPINTLMTHGFILSSHGQVSKNMDRDGIIREMRCAFACGSGMVELYCDHDLMTKYNLWGELAECIRWQEKNADVLPDIHWVGGNPWDGRNENIYGWASWNNKKATFSLRNGATKSKKFTIKLRDALQIPAYIQGTIKFTPSFSNQKNLSGFPVNRPIDIDETLNLQLDGSSFYSFDGIQEGGGETPVEPELTEVVCNVNISAENQYGTCILPFDAVLPASLKAYSCDNVNGDLLVLTEETTLKANTPYILYAAKGANETFRGQVNLQEIPSEVSVGLLTGVLKEKTLDGGQSRYVLQNHGKGARFYKVDSPVTVGANRCYLTVQSSTVQSFLFGGDATGIDTMEAAEDPNAPIYDLAGRRVQETIPGTIYIRNGKKFLAE